MVISWRNIIFGILALLTIGCSSEKNTFNFGKKYIGFWAETKWTYNFKTNGEYILESEGHGGGDPQYGEYILKDSLIILISDTESFEDWRFKRFRIDNQNGCIRDYWGYRYCSTEKELEEISEKKYQDEQELREEIEKLTLVLEKRKYLLDQDSTKQYRLRNKGIIVNNKEEYYEYQLESWLPEFRRYQVHLRLYAKDNPTRIFDSKFVEINKKKTAANK